MLNQAHASSSSPRKEAPLKPSFVAWQRRCASAMQPRPMQSRATLRPLERHYVLRSIADGVSTSSSHTVVTDGDIPPPPQQAGKSWSWGWWSGSSEDNQRQVATTLGEKGIDRTMGSASTTVMEDVKNAPAVLTEETDLESEEDRERRKQAEKWRNGLMASSPALRFMVKHLTLIGCSPIDAEGGLSNILIGKCDSQIAGGFMPSKPGQARTESGILLCSNHIFSKKHLEHTLTHEMLHWFDHCRFKADWNDLRHVACSEIRAASLSGDCRLSREINRMKFGFVKHHQECVRRRAVLSVQGHPSNPDLATAERMVDEVWDSCFNDTRPFDEIY